ncbi:hypothetical protein I3842_07G235500 [Carya illinoinensis]|uniref:Uncharacterized protein n=1 Tax=Carya illinoinensis TaxID=32201 RepID=A0A922EMS6_CARIL|nr:hypothetical protein I3842_07G235500 [Carya illinoinensis]
MSAATKASSFMPPTPSVSHAQPQRSPWHSPVPYLFGGLAATLGLIAFALLILACSYWRLAGQLDEREGQDERDLESGAGEGKEAGDSESKVAKVYEEEILVIMAGDKKPTFLATPVCAKAVSLGYGSGVKSENEERDRAESCETMKKEVGDRNEVATTEENTDSQETPHAQEHNRRAAWFLFGLH